MKQYFKISFFLLVFLMIKMTACLDFVEDGLEVEYGDSNASLMVNAISGENGAENEVISYSIEVSSAVDIKSCIVRASTEGKNGSGFNVSDSTFDDPFADHNYGTIRSGIKSFKVRYDYIIPENTNKSRISFLVVDDSGRIEIEKEIKVVPNVSMYDNIILFAKDNTFFDALAASEGKVYENIKDNYSQLSEENVAVQEKIDIVFYYNPDQKASYLVSTASSRLDQELTIENSTLFKKLNMPGEVDLAEINPARLAEITEEANYIEEGVSAISGIRVGDVIGFRADVNALNSLKAGILKVEGLHPGSVPRYDGISYVLECSLIIQN